MIGGWRTLGGELSKYTQIWNEIKIMDEGEKVVFQYQCRTPWCVHKGGEQPTYTLAQYDQETPHQHIKRARARPRDAERQGRGIPGQ